MNASRKYQLLNHIGIPYWLDRASVFRCHAPIFNARCLVLLPETINKQTPEEEKILTGMLNVLELQPKEICIAWIQTEDSTILRAELLKWAPESVLIMGEALATSMAEVINGLKHAMIIQVTHHQKHLLQSPEDKKKAYRDLLSLKQTLVYRKSV